MALNPRYNQNYIHPFFGNGFDEFFTPSPFFSREPFFDLMPVLSNLDRTDDMNLLRTSPGYEISETDNKYHINVDVPGVKAADINVDLENEGKVLHISGGRKVKQGDTTTETRFSKRFTIGPNVEVEKMTANLNNGVLTLEAPKKEKEEKKTFKIAITEGPPAPALEK